MLIKNKCAVGLTKQRSIIKNKKVNSLIKTCTCGRKSNSNNLNGSFVKKVATYTFIPVKFYILSTESREWIKLASHKKETKLSIPAKPNILINKKMFWQIKLLIRLRPVSYDMKVKPLIPDKSSVLINKSAMKNQVIYSKSKSILFIQVEYIVINRDSSIMKEKSIYRIGKKHPSRSLFISEKGSKEFWSPYFSSRRKPSYGKV
jgi:hypothetical protein